MDVARRKRKRSLFPTDCSRFWEHAIGKAALLRLVTTIDDALAAQAGGGAIHGDFCLRELTHTGSGLRKFRELGGPLAAAAFA